MIAGAENLVAAATRTSAMDPKDTPDTKDVQIECSDCGRRLDLRYRVVDRPPAREPVLGCPTCQSRRDVPPLVERLKAEAAPRFIEVVALQRAIEVGIGAAQRPADEAVSGRPPQGVRSTVPGTSGPKAP